MEKILKILLFLSILVLSAKAEWVVKSYQEIKNERVIRQTYEQSCGASSLATLLNILDDRKFDELKLLKTMSGQNLYTDMVSFADLNDAVKKLGYESNSYQINRENLDKLVNIPMLVKIEDDPRFPHFVVIINHKGNYLQILDPSHGEYISSKSQFFSIWDRYNKGGYVLIVAPKKDLKSFKLNTPKSLHFDFRPFSLY
ncbi:peptidase C39 [Campylobacter jejuni]|uniref:C39 family peptidase n=1 Tax=Campylobacter jejuni TaxID=197 RepID=UPI000F9AF666|nr:C39 family peptidase [Campylobacter jejuni]ELJ4225704.1 C39 family peptidase [Campylobacter coli]EAH6342838.1 peptidase C39 [Campylobacter jejuni]EAH7648507.1 peptidase C39 [Campylobacter jejuni]EAI3002165.1 peptidase C39 [Campylobacter jejuni]EAJ1786024.1 peptidase C39 [Campylobacter jejuni]